MQTTDPRRTPRPDSEERTPKQGAAARPLPVNRRAPQRRGPNQSMLVFAAVLAVIVLAAVLVLVLMSRHNRAPKDDPAALATPTAQITEQDTVLAEAKHLAAQYDYDKAIAAVTGFAGWENAPAAAGQGRFRGAEGAGRPLGRPDDHSARLFPHAHRRHFPRL